MAPLKFGDFEMQEKAEYEYLGDIISSGGLSALFEATIARRLFKTKGSIYKTAAIMKDFRMQVVGGMAGAFDIWERAIISSLLANCCSWCGIREGVLKALNGLEKSVLQDSLLLPWFYPTSCPLWPGRLDFYGFSSVGQEGLPCEQNLPENS